MSQRMTSQHDLAVLIADLRRNHELCPKEIILQAADELDEYLVKLEEKL